MNQKTNVADWDSFAADWIARCAQGEVNRDGFLDRAVWEVLGSVQRLKAIDIACGEGRFSRQLAARGVGEVLGVDLCAPLLAAAQRLKATDRERYAIDDMQTLATVGDAQFDLAVSYLALCDAPDAAAAIRQAARVLKPGGRYVVVNLAPMATAVNKRPTDPDGRRYAIRVEKYFDEGVRVCNFGRHKITNFHRSLTWMSQAFNVAGFRLTQISEPRPTAAEIAKNAGLANEVEAPSFIVYDLIKAE